LKMVGQHPVSSTKQLGDYSFHTVKYDIFPRWLMEKPWEGISFIAVEEQYYSSSEGVYEWDLVDQSWRNYANGLTDHAPEAAFEALEVGLRGEHRVGKSLRPQLYLSAIDQRIHLFGAEEGIWRFAEGSRIEYWDLDENGFVDRWKAWVDDRLKAGLAKTSGFLIYHEPEFVALTQIDTPDSVFTVAPPQNHDHWTTLQALLDNNQKRLSNDLSLIFEQFATSSLQIKHGELKAFRHTPNGFRFLLELQPGYALNGQDILGIQGNQPGQYLVEFDGDQFNVRPTAPASLRASDIHLAADSDAFQELQWISIETEIVNEGLEDSNALPLCARFTGPDGHQDVLTQTVTLIPGEGSVRVAWEWLPVGAGTWHLRVETDRNAAADSPDSQEVLVTAAIKIKPNTPDLLRLIAVTGGEPCGIAVLLASIVLFGAGIAAFWIRAQGLGEAELINSHLSDYPRAERQPGPTQNIGDKED
jgi:hypothetical protein